MLLLLLAACIPLLVEHLYIYEMQSDTMVHRVTNHSRPSVAPVVKGWGLFFCRQFLILLPLTTCLLREVAKVTPKKRPKKKKPV